MGRRLEQAGLAGYEPDTLACFLAAIQESGSQPVFDVGANIGVFSWLASALTPATVVAFEPTPDLTVQMRSICAANSLGVVVEEMALGAAPGTAELHLSDSTARPPTRCEPVSDRRTGRCPFPSRPSTGTPVGRGSVQQS